MDRLHHASTEGAADARTLPSKQAQADDELAACQARLDRLRSALQALPDGVVVVDAQGRIAEMNLGAAHLTGWAVGDCLGIPLHEVVQFRDAQGRPVDLLAPLANDAAVNALVRRDSHQVLVEACLTPLFAQFRFAPDGEAPATIGSVLTFRNVTAARRINDELTYHATHDALTGVLNRRAFESRLKRAVANAQDHGTPHALLFLDLDRFKAVNDHSGHIAGDELLRALSGLLQRNLREHDTLARLGGDEFAMLLAHCTPGEARVVARRVREAVAEFRFAWQDEVYQVGASIGLVTFRNGALTPKSLLLRADELCYLAKANGRNQVQAAAAERPAARLGTVPKRRHFTSRR